MRAVVSDRYGPPDVQRLEEVHEPAPNNDELLVRIRATTVNRTDCGLRAASPFFIRVFTGLIHPRRTILGMEFAGEIEAVGAAVTEFAPGDEVFGVKGAGAHAEFVCVKESAAVAHKPIGMTFEQAAAVCDGACAALSCLHSLELGEGREILVYGASGSIGTAAVQLVKHFGASVTAVCNTKNVELVRSLGADEVIDYTQDDFTKNGRTYDVIFDAVGKHSFRRSRRSLKPNGIFIETDGGFMWHAPFLSLLTKRMRMGIARYKREDVLFLKQLIEAGEYRAVIDRTYPIEDIVAATEYVETEQKTGNVVVTVA
jgi:NADPH:quinone reductase-like Zn-dependent oxidoreductase